VKIVSPYGSAASLPVVTAERMRELDRQATEEFGIPSLILMENAGRAVAMTALAMLKDHSRARVIIACGPGNNGGDGFVAARHLHNAGVDVLVVYYGTRSKAAGDALANIVAAERLPLDILPNPGPAVLSRLALESDLVIDALLGTGIKGALKPPYDDVLSTLKRDFRCPVLAVDIPSGLDADDGSVAGRVVHADRTVTFALPKIGLLTHPGAAYAGDIVVADIGIPWDALKNSSDCRVALGDLSEVFASRDRAAHKGDFGRLAVVAGSVGMTGAAALAAQGALRVGAGLVTVVIAESLNDIMEVKLTEAMTAPVPESGSRALGPASLDSALCCIEKRDAAVIGPGIGRREETVELALDIIRCLSRPAVLDADALYAVSKDISALKSSKAPLVLTPHPGEMAMLLGTDVSEVQSNRLEIARSFAAQHGVVLVLKGAGSVVAEPGGRAFINTTGNPGMATGGTGDVLSGMIGGLLAMGLDAFDAANCAVYVHGLAGDLAAERLGEASMLASDLAERISEAILCATLPQGRSELPSISEY